MRVIMVIYIIREYIFCEIVEEWDTDKGKIKVKKGIMS